MCLSFAQSDSIKRSSKLDGVLKRCSTQTFAKLTAVWNKKNRSTNDADLIQAAIGSLLVTPGDTRWNSTYDAVAKMHKEFCNAELEGKMDKVFDDLGVKRLTPQQKVFVAEYVEVMKPLCCGLDYLQGEKDIGLSYLLPTLTLMKGQLKDMIERVDNSLTICAPLAQVILNGLNTRFADVFADSKAKLAAAVHPKFKMRIQCKSWNCINY